MRMPVLLGEGTAVPEDVLARELAVLQPVQAEERLLLGTVPDEEVAVMARLRVTVAKKHGILGVRTILRNLSL